MSFQTFSSINYDDSRASQQCNMFPYGYTVYCLPPVSSGFLLAKKILITCVMRHARTHYS